MSAPVSGAVECLPSHPLVPLFFRSVLMTSFGVLLILILIALAAVMADQYSQLRKQGWLSGHFHNRSVLDPVGSALGELGRADMPYKAFTAVFGAIGKASELLYAPIGAALSGVGKGLELVFKPIGAVLGMIGGAKR